MSSTNGNLQTRVAGIDFLGNFSLPAGTEFDGTVLGGLSSIQYIPEEDVYYAISDDQANYRYYTFEIDISDGRLDDGDVTPLSVAFLTDADGQPLADGSLDPEELTQIGDGTYFVTNEGFANGEKFENPSVFVFDSETNVQVGEISFDEKFDADPAGKAGIRNNAATEAGTITPDGTTFYSGFENALLQDGPQSTPTSGSPSRIVEWDIATGEAIAEYVYQNYPNSAQPDPEDAFQVNGITALLTLDDAGTLLALERNFAVGDDQTGTGHGGFLYEVSTAQATNVLDEDSLEGLFYQSVDKRFLLDLSTLRDSDGNQVVIDNVEGLTFGPELEDGRQSLFIVSDDNFSDSQSSQFMAFAVELEGDVEATEPDLTFAAYNTMLSSPADPEDGGAGDLEAPGDNPDGTPRDNLFNRLDGGEYEVAQNLAYVIQTERPDILLLNEIDFDERQDDDQTLSSAQVFNDQYLAVGQSGQSGIDYPYVYVFSSNTGVPSGFDINNDGIVGEINPETGLIGGFAPSEADAVELRDDTEPRDQSPEVFLDFEGEFVKQPNDAFGFGRYEGQYSMALYSMYPVLEEDIRTFQNFLWKDMPGNKLSEITPDVRPLFDPDRPFDPLDPENPDTSFFTEEEYNALRLSSKNHVDIPVDVDGQVIHILGSHPTPATYSLSSTEQNESRNFDEVRFWADYINGENYMYDDEGVAGGLEAGSSFIIAGDLNADPFDGAALPGAANQLLEDPLVIGSATDESITPASLGGVQDDDSTPENPQFGNPAFDTVDYSLSEPGRGNVRVDYALPSTSGFELVGQEVIWPLNEDPLSNFVDYPTSDHKMVKIEVNLTTPSEPARFATFNVALNRSSAGELIGDLEGTDNAQAQTLAEIIQRVNPDVLFLNEIDYDEQGEALDSFLNNYLAVSQAEGLDPVDYPYIYLAESNTGIQSGFDLDNDGEIGGPGDAFGFGFFPGQFAMAFVSKYPILEDEVRTFQQFLWKDMPDALLPDDPDTPEPADWFSPEELEVVRLSSKNHWDIPVQLPDGEVVHVLGSHPTPPVFDGPEDRNGRRNHDEIRFWSDYITPDVGDYIYDDEEFAAAGNTTPESPSGGLAAGSRFVIVGDQNADPFDGDSTMNAARQFTENPLIDNSVIPSSEGGVDASDRQGGINLEHVGNPAYDTGDFNDESPGNLRVDYVLPSNNLEIMDANVFWPPADDPLFDLVGDFDPTVEPEGFPSSDHRMVYVDLMPQAVSDGPFELQILHTSDQEAGIAAFNDAPGLSAILNALDDDYDNTLKLSSGDLFIAGPFSSASADIYENGFPGIADILVQNELGWAAAAVGNHEFDFGDGAFFDLLAPNAETTNGEAGGQGIGEAGYLGTLFPYLATNLDYSGAELPEGLNVVESGNAPEANSLTGSVVVDVNGESIGVLGAVTPYLPTIANIGNVQMLTGDDITPSTSIAEQVDALIANLEPEVQALTEAGINKIVLMTHLQEAEIEQALAQALAEREIPVDVLIGGGSHRVMASEDDPLREDETQQNNGLLLQPYPQTFSAVENTVYYVNTDANYRYLSQLVVTFDENGIITEIGDDSGTFATDIAGVDRLYDEDITTIDQVKAVADPEVVAIVEGVQGFVNDLDGDIFGQTDVFLNGIRGDVRTQETNLGNLAADAQDFYAEEYLDTYGDDLLAGFDTIDVSFKNGGGIRDQIGQSFIPGGGGELVQLPPAANPGVGKEEGDISALDISNSLRFDNTLVVGKTTAAGLYELFEHAVSGIEIVSGRFAQVGGIRYSFDPEAQPRTNDQAGERIQNLVVLNEDGSIKDVVVEDGELVGDPDREFSLTTLEFLAGGGDGYPDVITDQKPLGDFTEPDTLGAADLASGGEQDALAEYLAATFNQDNGQDSFMEADTSQSGDERIQNLAFREDTVLGEGPTPGPVPLAPVFGSLEGETIDIIGSNQLVFAGAGDDLLLASGSTGGNTIFAGSGNDVAVLGQGDTYFGDAGDDRFFAQTGGNNILTGGAGADQFWISTAELPEATNVITDFTSGEDVLGVAGIGASFEGLVISQSGADTAIAFGETELAILNGVDATTLTAMDFAFA